MNERHSCCGKELEVCVEEMEILCCEVELIENRIIETDELGPAKVVNPLRFIYSKDGLSWMSTSANEGLDAVPTSTFHSTVTPVIIFSTSSPLLG